MPIEYWIEKDRRRVRAVVTGDFTTDEMLRAVQGSTQDSEFEPGFDVLSDHTQVGEPLTTQQAKQLSSYLQDLQSVMAHARWAVVTSKPASVGMMRMLGVLLEQVPMELRVFTAMDEAEAWLSQPKQWDRGG